MIDGEEAGERFSLVEHPLSARALAAPLHRHAREEEYKELVQRFDLRFPGEPI